jgi:hypothetical protein
MLRVVERQRDDVRHVDGLLSPFETRSATVEWIGTDVPGAGRSESTVPRGDLSKTSTIFGDSFALRR